MWTDFSKTFSNFKLKYGVPSDTLCFLNFLPLVVVGLVPPDFFTGTGSCGNQGIEVIKESPQFLFSFLLGSQETVILAVIRNSGSHR